MRALAKSVLSLGLIGKIDPIGQIGPIGQVDATIRRPLRALTVLTGLIAAAGLGGCGILSPLPAWELVKATGTATSTALATAAPAKASNTVHHGDAPVRDVCIEFNRNAPLEDLVPSLQAELRKQGVESRVFEAGTGLQQCGVWLRYVATIEWGVPPMASAYRANLSAASLSLHRSDGTLLSTSSYQAEENYGIARWAGTRNKIAPVVKALITGFES